MSVPKEIRDAGLLSINEVAAIMGVHRATVWNWIRQGKLRCVVPLVPSKDDPSVKVPVSERYRGVARADLAEWRRVFPSQAKPVKAVSPKRRAPTEQKRKTRGKRR